MRLRQLLPLGSLGLLAALLAHTASYGNDHIAGGTHHFALDLLAVGGVGGFVALVATLAVLGAGRQADGSVLAASLRPFVPSFGSLLVSASCWFAAIESIEPEHLIHAPILIIAFCLIVAAALLAFACSWLIQAIAAIALAFIRVAFASRAATYNRRFERPSSARRTDVVYRRFARPPPALTLLPI